MLVQGLLVLQANVAACRVRSHRACGSAVGWASNLGNAGLFVGSGLVMVGASETG